MPNATCGFQGHPGGHVHFQKGKKTWRSMQGVCATRRGLAWTKSKHETQHFHFRDFPGGAVVKNPPADAGDTGSIPDPGRSHKPRSN